MSAGGAAVAVGVVLVVGGIGYLVVRKVQSEAASTRASIDNAAGQLASTRRDAAGALHIAEVFDNALRRFGVK